MIKFLFLQTFITFVSHLIKKMDMEDQLLRLERMIKEVRKNTVSFNTSNLIMLLKIANRQLEIEESGFGSNFKSGLRNMCEDLVEDLENGKKINLF